MYRKTNQESNDMGTARERLYQTAGKQNQTQQPGSVRTINHLKPFVHLPGRGQLAMYNNACYRSFDSLVLLLRKFEREKNDLDALVDGAAPGLSRSLSELVALKLLVVD